MKKLLLSAAFLASVSTQSYALNDREQGILIGAVIASILNQHRPTPNQPPMPPVYHPPVVREVIREPVIVYPYPYPNAVGRQYCASHPYYDRYGRMLGYTYTCH